MDLAGWVVGVVERFGLAGVAFLVALENLVPPVPSEVVLPMAGFAVARGSFSFPAVVLAATVGSVAGALILYGIARRVGEPRARDWVSRHGNWLMLDGDDVDHAQTWFDRHGHWAVLFGRLAPGVRSIVSLPAGFAHMSIARFTLFTTLGSLAWNAALIGLGLWLGAQWEIVSRYVDAAGWVIWLLLAAGATLFLARRHHARARRGERA